VLEVSARGFLDDGQSMPRKFCKTPVSWVTQIRVWSLEAQAEVDQADLKHATAVNIIEKGIPWKLIQTHQGNDRGGGHSCQSAPDLGVRVTILQSCHCAVVILSLATGSAQTLDVINLSAAETENAKLQLCVTSAEVTSPRREPVGDKQALLEAAVHISAKKQCVWIVSTLFCEN
jgi:hypothetical protein